MKTSQRFWTIQNQVTVIAIIAIIAIIIIFLLFTANASAKDQLY